MSDNETLIVEGSWGPSELDVQADSFIKDFAAKFNADEVAPEAAPAPKLVEPPKDPHENTVEEPKVDPKVEDRGLERLVEREVALRTKEQGIFAREEALKGLEAKIKAAESRLVPPDLMTKFEYEPEEALKSMGLDPDMIVRQVIANRLGSEAPEQMRNTIENSRMKRELAEMKSEMLRYQREFQARQYVEQVHAGAREFVSKGLEASTPTVASVAKGNPERVYREIMEEISRDAATRAQRGDAGDVLSYAEAAKRVEAKWSDYRSILSPAPAQAQAPLEQPNTPVKKTEPTPVPVSSTSVKPPERPIAPWLVRRDDEEEGIKAALAAFRAQESKG